VGHGVGRAAAQMVVTVSLYSRLYENATFYLWSNASSQKIADMNTPTAMPLSIEDIAQCIRIVRGKRVLPETDLAAFYGVGTGVFNQQVRRNLTRFPYDFMFQIDAIEHQSLRSRFVTSSSTATSQTTPRLPQARS
jgi:ORF6N domain